MSVFVSVLNGTVRSGLISLPEDMTLARAFPSMDTSSYVLVQGTVVPLPGWTFDGMNFSPPDTAESERT